MNQLLLGIQMNKFQCYADVSKLRNYLVDLASGKSVYLHVYVNLRNQVQYYPEAWNRLPEIIQASNAAQEIIDFLSHRFATNEERFEYVSSQFKPIMDWLQDETTPSDEYISTSLEKLQSDNVTTEWKKALQRRSRDPDGAITIARTLLMTVCKTILDKLGEDYEQNLKLPKLYGMVASKLDIAPSEQSEDVVRKIFGGCHAIVDGLCEIRGLLGDAHGKGNNTAIPVERHATLAINIAGAMAAFLVETWESHQVQPV